MKVSVFFIAAVACLHTSTTPEAASSATPATSEHILRAGTTAKTGDAIGETEHKVGSECVVATQLAVVVTDAFAYTQLLLQNVIQTERNGAFVFKE